MLPYDFYHATDARRHGIGTLVFVHIFIILFCGILYLFHSLGMNFDRRFLFGMGGVLALVYAGFLIFSLILIIRGGKWVFAICDGDLRVKSPARAVGETFSVRVADIVSITQRASGGEPPSSYFLITCKDGTNHEITQNSGLDREKLFAKLVELNPDIHKEYNTLSDSLGAVRSRVSGQKRSG
jgi:hypothetical protein